MKTNLLLTLIFLIFVHPSYSQTPTPTATPDPSENVVKARPNTAFVISDSGSNNSQNVVLGNAINLVKPPYPPAAKAVRASGAVNVNVLIDENGNVVSAKAISGNQYLSPTAEAAARASKFSPTFVNGEKVKASGSIVYNFEIISGFNTTVKITAFPIIAPVPQTLNGKAVYLAKPPYPKEARDAGVSGRVNVQVTINEDGKVISAKAISGPTLLAKVSEDAAFASRFTPTFMSGKPVNVTGVVVYNFEPINPYLPQILWFDKAMALTLYSKEKWQNGFITIFERAADSLPNEMAEEKNLLRQVKIQPENRTETVKKVFDLFEKKLSAENVWQIKMANVVSSIFIETRNFTQETNYQLNKDDLKSYLGQLKGLYETKPSDFPLDLENTVKPLIELSDKNLSDTTVIIQILQHSKKLLAQAMNQ